MPSLRILAAAAVLLGLSACDSGSGDAGAMTGVWSGTAEFKADTLMAGQNFRVVADYVTRFEFEVNEDEDGLVLGSVRVYNTGTLRVREPRDAGGQRVIEHAVTWDDDLVQSWPVYGTFRRPTFELDLPEAEEAGVFAKDLWTFTVVGDRARLDNTTIAHGYTFEVFEDYDAPHVITLTPTKSDEFSIRRQ